MPGIKVNTSKLVHAESDMKAILGKVKSISTNFSDTANNLDWDISSDFGVSSKISKINQMLESQTKTVDAMQNFLSYASAKYDEADKTCKTNKTVSSSSKVSLSGAVVGDAGKESKGMEKLKSSVSKFGPVGAFIGGIEDLRNAYGKSSIYGMAKGAYEAVKGLDKSAVDILYILKKWKKGSDNKVTINMSKLQQLFGLKHYRRGATRGGEASWAQEYERKYKFKKDPKALKKRIADAKDTGKLGKVKKLGGKVLSGFQKLIELDTKYNDKISSNKNEGRSITESLLEMLIESGSKALLTLAAGAAITAVMGTAGFPAVLASGVAIAAGGLIDIVCERITGKTLSEFLSEKIADIVPKEAFEKLSPYVKKIAGKVKEAKSAVAGWVDKAKNFAGEKFVQAKGAIASWWNRVNGKENMAPVYI